MKSSRSLTDIGAQSHYGGRDSSLSSVCVPSGNGYSTNQQQAQSTQLGIPTVFAVFTPSSSRLSSTHSTFERALSIHQSLLSINSALDQTHEELRHLRLTQHRDSAALTGSYNSSRNRSPSLSNPSKDPSPVCVQQETPKRPSTAAKVTTLLPCTPVSSRDPILEESSLTSTSSNSSAPHERETTRQTDALVSTNVVTKTNGDDSKQRSSAAAIVDLFDPLKCDSSSAVVDRRLVGRSTLTPAIVATKDRRIDTRRDYCQTNKTSIANGLNNNNNSDDGVTDRRKSTIAYSTIKSKSLLNRSLSNAIYAATNKNIAKSGAKQEGYVYDDITYAANKNITKSGGNMMREGYSNGDTTRSVATRVRPTSLSVDVNSNNVRSPLTSKSTNTPLSSSPVSNASYREFFSRYREEMKHYSPVKSSASNDNLKSLTANDKSTTPVRSHSHGRATPSSFANVNMSSAFKARHDAMSAKSGVNVSLSAPRNTSSANKTADSDNEAMFVELQRKRDALQRTMAKRYSGVLQHSPTSPLPSKFNLSQLGSTVRSTDNKERTLVDINDNHLNTKYRPNLTDTSTSNHYTPNHSRKYLTSTPLVPSKLTFDSVDTDRRTPARDRDDLSLIRQQSYRRRSLSDIRQQTSRMNTPSSSKYNNDDGGGSSSDGELTDELTEDARRRVRPPNRNATSVRFKSSSASRVKSASQYDLSCSGGSSGGELTDELMEEARQFVIRSSSECVLCQTQPTTISNSSVKRASSSAFGRYSPRFDYTNATTLNADEADERNRHSSSRFTDDIINRHSSQSQFTSTGARILTTYSSRYKPSSCPDISGLTSSNAFRPTVTKRTY